jgi:hypothetical protein
MDERFFFKNFDDLHLHGVIPNRGGSDVCMVVFPVGCTSHA